MHAHLTSADYEIARSVTVLRGLPAPLLQRLLGPATVTTLSEGETVFCQGDRATAFFIVAEGWVKLYRIAVTGSEAVLNVLTKGDSFAEAVAFYNGIYPATAEAVSKARVIRIPADHVINCVRQTPDIALAMIASTSAHLHNLVLQVEQLKAQTGVQRVAEFLVSLSPAKSGPAVIALPYDKVLVAGRLGLKPESLSRAFAKLRAYGVEVRASQVVIRDVGQLRRYAASRQDAAPAYRAASGGEPSIGLQSFQQNELQGERNALPASLRGRDRPIEGGAPLPGLRGSGARRLALSPRDLET